MTKSVKTYLLNVAIAADQFVNTVLGGQPDETMSSRAWRNSLKGYWYAKWSVKILDTVFGWLGDSNHCKTSYENERVRAHLGAGFS